MPVESRNAQAKATRSHCTYQQISYDCSVKALQVCTSHLSWDSGTEPQSQPWAPCNLGVTAAEAQEVGGGRWEVVVGGGEEPRKEQQRGLLLLPNPQNLSWRSLYSELDTAFLDKKEAGREECHLLGIQPWRNKENSSRDGLPFRLRKEETFLSSWWSVCWCG